MQLNPTSNNESYAFTILYLLVGRPVHKYFWLLVSKKFVPNSPSSFHVKLWLGFAVAFVAGSVLFFYNLDRWTFVGAFWFVLNNSMLCGLVLVPCNLAVKECASQTCALSRYKVGDMQPETQVEVNFTSFFLIVMSTLFSVGIFWFSAYVFGGVDRLSAQARNSLVAQESRIGRSDSLGEVQKTLFHITEEAVSGWRPAFAVYLLWTYIGAQFSYSYDGATACAVTRVLLSFTIAFNSNSFVCRSAPSGRSTICSVSHEHSLCHQSEGRIHFTLL